MASNIAAHAEGYQTTAMGEDSHAEGYLTVAAGDDSHAEGAQTYAGGARSHAEGSGYGKCLVRALNNDGSYTVDLSVLPPIGAEVSLVNSSDKEIGVRRSTIIAVRQIASNGGTIWTAENIGTQTSDAYIRIHTGAIADNSHSEGASTLSKGSTSHAEGYLSAAYGNQSHAEGNNTYATGTNAHVEGSGYSSSVTVISHSGLNLEISGNYANSIGRAIIYKNKIATITSATYDSSSSKTIIVLSTSLDTIPAGTYVNMLTGAHGYNAHAEGSSTVAGGYSAHAEGSSTIASGSSAHAEGSQTEATGNYSHAEGSSTKATADYSHAEGSQTVASGQYSHAEGCRLTASGVYSHGEGFGQPDMEKTVSSYSGSTLYMNDSDTADLPGSSVSYNGYTAFVKTVGGSSVYLNTTLGGSMSSGTKLTFKKGAIGTYSHIEGYKTSAIGAGAHAEGLRTGACEAGSHTSGIGTIAAYAGQTVVGLPNSITTDMFVVGGGEYDSDYKATTRKNLFTVGTDGKLTATGNLQLGGGLITVPKGDFIVNSSANPTKNKSTKSVSASFTTGSSFSSASGTISSYSSNSISISVSVKQIAQTAILPGSRSAGVTIKGSSGSVNKSFSVNSFPSGYNKSSTSSYTISLTSTDLTTLFGTSVTRGTSKTVSYSVY